MSTFLLSGFRTSFSVKYQQFCFVCFSQICLPASCVSEYLEYVSVLAPFAIWFLRGVDTTFTVHIDWGSRIRILGLDLGPQIHYKNYTYIYLYLFFVLPLYIYIIAYVYTYLFIIILKLYLKRDIKPFKFVGLNFSKPVQPTAALYWNRLP